ncbi:exonuclease [Gordonia phage Daredevil]|uniref:Uncharacterized protein n=1 Tax=Gordonia phage Daredevil TaxID=2283286 RepID=A0A345MIQ0_9CAUD|nr:exonuclease [Gordonia phage Daredevil]AXH70431.1 hypothetical protein SEA_DAREDEVIL_44 [Gordonia phage Daredevil]
MTYEEKKAELNGLVQKIEKGGLTLDEQLELWNRGKELIDELEKMLGTYEDRIKEGHAA